MVKYFYIFITSLFVITSCYERGEFPPRKCYWEFGSNSCDGLEHEWNATLELY